MASTKKATPKATTPKTTAKPETYMCAKHGKTPAYVCRTYRTCRICAKARRAAWVARKKAGKVGIWTATELYAKYGAGREDGKKPLLKAALTVPEPKLKAMYAEAENGGRDLPTPKKAAPKAKAAKKPAPKAKRAKKPAPVPPVVEPVEVTSDDEGDMEAEG